MIESDWEISFASQLLENAKAKNRKMTSSPENTGF
jgi:hypothetical protein